MPGQVGRPSKTGILLHPQGDLRDWSSDPIVHKTSSLLLLFFTLRLCMILGFYCSRSVCGKKEQLLLNSSKCSINGFVKVMEREIYNSPRRRRAKYGISNIASLNWTCFRRKWHLVSTISSRFIVHSLSLLWKNTCMRYQIKQSPLKDRPTAG